MIVEKRHLVIFSLLFVVVIALNSYGNSPKDLKTLTINNLVINVEIADNPKEQAKGLMFRKNLESNHGMLFIFERLGRHPFWMKNTLIPLDMLWLDSELRVVHIENSVPPCRENPCISYASPNLNAKYVLEVNGGWSIENSIKVNDQVEIEL